MVEVFLIESGTTLFWDRLSHRWPDAEPIDVKGLPVAPREYLAAYRRDYTTIRAPWSGRSRRSPIGVV